MGSALNPRDYPGILPAEFPTPPGKQSGASGLAIARIYPTLVQVESMKKKVQLQTGRPPKAKTGLLGFLKWLIGLGRKHPQAAVPPPPEDEPTNGLSPVIGPLLGKVMVINDDAVHSQGPGFQIEVSRLFGHHRKGSFRAFAQIRAQKPDVILLDVNFPTEEAFEDSPGWDGLGLMGWLNRLEETRNLPVIIISGTETIGKKALAAGALAFFPKPIDHDRMLTVIHDRLHPKPPAGPAPGIEDRKPARDTAPPSARLGETA